MSIEGLLNQTVRIAHRTSVSGQPVDNYGASSPFPARIQPLSAALVSKEGLNTQVKAKVFLAPDVEVGVTDRITLPDGEDYRILEVHEVADGYGMVAYKMVVV